MRRQTDDDIQLDGVLPPPGQGPTLVVWREYGRYRDQLRGWLALAAVYGGLGVLILVANAGLHPDLGGTLVVLGVCAAFWALMASVMMTARSVQAAGRGWYRNSSGPRSVYTWVRTDQVVRASVVNRSSAFGPAVVFEDRDGRRASVYVKNLHACEPLRRAITDSLDAAWPFDCSPAAVAHLTQGAGKPEGRVVVRGR